MLDKKVSVIIPLLNEEESIPELIAWIRKVMNDQKFDYEVIMVDDGSKDNSWEVIRDLRTKDPNVKGVKFSRNFGKSAALNTGFKMASGDVVITMDADLQDSPDEIPELTRMIREDGFDMVSGWKKKRHDPISKTIPSRFFNFVTRIISGVKLHDFNCGLKAYKRDVIKNIEVYGEMHRYIPVISNWNGFSKIGEKVVEHRARKYGTTKFGLERFINGFLDLLSITFVSKFKRRPMHFFGVMGMLSFSAGILFTLKLLWDKLDSIYISEIPLKREITEQPLFYMALVAVIIGAQLFLTGFLAELVALKSNSHNDYIITETVGSD